jgi:hypothetical protein
MTDEKDTHGTDWDDPNTHDRLTDSSGLVIIPPDATDEEEWLAGFPCFRLLL